MSDRDASMPDLPDPDGEALKFDFRTPSLATTPFTFDRPTPITRPTVDPLAGPTGEVQRILAQILPAALEDVVKGTLDTLLQQAVASMEQKLSGTLNTLHADVKSLDTAVRRLDKARLPAPKRSLDSVIPKITIELTGNDYNIVAGRTRKQLLNQLHDQSPAVFKLIRVARLRRNHREVILETESWSAYRELIKTNRIAEITKRLCLQNLRSTIKHEKFWVVLLEHNFDESYLKDCTTHLNQWRLDTKLDIRGTLYKDNRLLWYFTTAHEATKACQRPLWFGEDRALAL
ncbi:hypothetical protein J4E83_007225 [Alternaria metachromatica]|uniref:uncharacterized protein n=1 Tax=Alternaria metachromatica TaxID=283354 RepID=UPI0020C28A38|nr:uncharacterized protein J4E83_007225 [Alternaria metachromatica]KAI4614571.1 hypothetical protein J4E83_007225 [Alternaria metachromatica]